MSTEVKSGVSLFEGAMSSQWYGWASKGKAYREGSLHRLKCLAKLDARRLRKQLGG